MANANPSGPGARNMVVKEDIRPEPNLKSNESYVRQKDGTIVKRTLMHNGNVQNDTVWTEDFKSVAITEDAWKKKFLPSDKKES